MTAQERYEIRVKEIESLPLEEQSKATEEAYEKYMIESYFEFGNPEYLHYVQRKAADKFSTIIIQHYLGNLSREDYERRRVDDVSKFYAQTLAASGIAGEFSDDWIEDYARRSMAVEDAIFAGRSNLALEEMEELCKSLYCLSHIFYRDYHREFGSGFLHKNPEEDYIWEGV